MVRGVRVRILHVSGLCLDMTDSPRASRYGYLTLLDCYWPAEQSLAAGGRHEVAPEGSPTAKPFLSCVSPFASKSEKMPCTWFRFTARSSP